MFFFEGGRGHHFCPSFRARVVILATATDEIVPGVAIACGLANQRTHPRLGVPYMVFNAVPLSSCSFVRPTERDWVVLCGMWRTGVAMAMQALPYPYRRGNNLAPLQPLNITTTDEPKPEGLCRKILNATFDRLVLKVLHI